MIAARTAVIVGASGGIGGALLRALEKNPNVGRIVAASRQPLDPASSKVECVRVDLQDEPSIAALADTCREAGEIDLVIVATGVLHAGDAFGPEKRLADIDAENLAYAFAVNSIGPAMLARHLLPLLASDNRSVFAALSARVGSIGDNRLGGWYAYRASKAALNMLIRTAAIELGRNNPGAVCIGLHPGTVATSLSEPFRRRVDPGRLVSADQAAENLLGVIENAKPGQSGCCLAWDGSEVPP